MERMKILLSGMVAGDPWQGGATWAVLQYLVGLRQLGHDVLLVEPVEATSLHPRGSALAASENASYFSRLPLVGDDAGSALMLDGTEETLGTPYGAVLEFAQEADLLINISGMLADPRLLEPIPVRAFLDLDPGFNQLWHETGEDVGLAAHNRFVTVGQAIGAATCPVPTCGVSWIPTLPPVVLEQWPPAAAAPRRDAFTTVGHWRSYGPIKHGGIHYGQRAHSLRELISLPGRTGARFELALGIHPDETDDLEALAAEGWELLDPVEVAGTPDRYRDFIASSKAELGVAKSGYVASRCGWFSDRSASYLASARPVVAQETGFSDFLPVGEGLLAFSTLDEAVGAVEEVERDWERHSRAARSLAEERLDSDKVLARLIERLGTSG
jgi:hypothetical protein